MKEVVHLACATSVTSLSEREIWCGKDTIEAAVYSVTKATCLACLLACAEYGSEARHRYEVLREQGVKP